MNWLASTLPRAHLASNKRVENPHRAPIFLITLDKFQVFGMILIGVVRLTAFKNEHQRDIKVDIIDFSIQVTDAASNMHADDASGKHQVQMTLIHEGLAIFWRIVLEGEEHAVGQLAGCIGHGSKSVKIREFFGKLNGQPAK